MYVLLTNALFVMVMQKKNFKILERTKPKSNYLKDVKPRETDRKS
jgi:hypothetical protein